MTGSDGSINNSYVGRYYFTDILNNSVTMRESWDVEHSAVSLFVDNDKSLFKKKIPLFTTYFTTFNFAKIISTEIIRIVQIGVQEFNYFVIYQFKQRELSWLISVNLNSIVWKIRVYCPRLAFLSWTTS